MLELKDVTKRYGSEWAVRGVCLSLGKGRLAALLGPNGSGKTTLMKMVAGLVRPTSGEILFDGVPVGVSTKRHIAYMPTEAYFYGYMTALDAGKYYRDFFRDFSMERYQNMLQEEKLDSALKIRAMSSGMMAKLKLALAFSRDSRLVMLDEPLNGIDILARAHAQADRAKPRPHPRDDRLQPPGGRAGGHDRRRDLCQGRRSCARRGRKGALRTARKVDCGNLPRNLRGGRGWSECLN